MASHSLRNFNDAQFGSNGSAICRDCVAPNCDMSEVIGVIIALHDRAAQSRQIALPLLADKSTASPASFPPAGL
jgi:hypothetical protein